MDAALHELKDERLVRFVLPSHGRSVVRYRHVLDEALGLDAGQSAILGMLLLRGPQTAGELRVRTERMVPLDGLHGVEHELELLATRTEPLAASVGRRPGQKEERWACPWVAAYGRRPGAASGIPTPRRPRSPTWRAPGEVPEAAGIARASGRRPARGGRRAPIRRRPAACGARGAARQPRRLSGTYSGVT